MFAKHNLVSATNVTLLKEQIIKTEKYSFKVMKESATEYKIKIEAEHYIFFINIMETGCKLNRLHISSIEEEIEALIELESFGILTINFNEVVDKEKLYERLLLIPSIKNLKDIKTRISLTITDMNEVFLNNNIEKLLTFLEE